MEGWDAIRRGVEEAKGEYDEWTVRWKKNDMINERKRKDREKRKDERKLWEKRLRWKQRERERQEDQEEEREREREEWRRRDRGERRGVWGGGVRQVNGNPWS